MKDDIWKLIICILAVFIVMVSCHTRRLVDEDTFSNLEDEHRMLSDRVYDLEHS